MHPVCIVTTLGALYSGGIMGVRATVRMTDAAMATLDVHVAGHSFITAGSAALFPDGSFEMDEDTVRRLTNRGVRVERVDVAPDRIRLSARIPFFGVREVTLHRRE